MGKADQSKEQAQSKSQHRAEREIKRRRATSGRPFIIVFRHKKRLHSFVQPFAIYAILSFYIAYMKQFMLSALEDTIVKLIHKRIFF